MAVGVDEPGGDDEPRGVDGLLCVSLEVPAYRGDLLAGDGEVSPVPGVARAVDDLPVPDYEVV